MLHQYVCCPLPARFKTNKTPNCLPKATDLSSSKAGVWGVSPFSGTGSYALPKFAAPSLLLTCQILIQIVLKEWLGLEWLGFETWATFFFFWGLFFNLKSFPDSAGTKKLLKLGMSHGRLYGNLVNLVGKKWKWKHALTVTEAKSGFGFKVFACIVMAAFL